MMIRSPLFELGTVVPIGNVVNIVTPGTIWELLKRHQSGDWGLTIGKDLPEREAETAWRWNCNALEKGGQLVSRYTTPGDHDIVVVTQADRRATAFMTWEDYRTYFVHKPMKIPEEILRTI